MSYEVIHSSYKFNKEDIVLIEKKLKDYEINNSGIESDKSYSDFYENISNSKFI